jgi:hypothetical protein
MHHHRNKYQGEPVQAAGEYSGMAIPAVPAVQIEEQAIKKNKDQPVEDELGKKSWLEEIIKGNIEPEKQGRNDKKIGEALVKKPPHFFSVQISKLIRGSGCHVLPT